MKGRDDRVTVTQILQYGGKAVELADGRAAADLREDETYFHASVRLITVVGEAVKRLSPQFRQRHPEVPWQSIAGMRDKMIHDYEHIDHSVVWGVLTDHLPRLLAVLEPIATTFTPLDVAEESEAIAPAPHDMGDAAAEEPN